LGGEGLRALTDLHRRHKASLSIALSKPLVALKDIPVPGSKATKYKRERDLIGLAGEHRLCLFTAEADVEEAVRLRTRLLESQPRLTIHSNLQDCHLYLLSRWVSDYIIADRNISTIKGELLPILCSKQFSSGSKAQGGDRQRLLDYLPTTTTIGAANKKEDTRFGCYALHLPAEIPCLRVNTTPHYWEANRNPSLAPQLQERANIATIHSRAEIGEKAQLQATRVGEGSVVANKTSLTNVQLGHNCRVEEKVRLSNCVIMDNVTIQSGSHLQDSIICDSSTVSGAVKNCIVGKGQVLAEGGSHESQTLLSKDRMMEI